MSVVKKVRSENFNSCKISYDSFISITKLFTYNFNKLTEEEKLEFKSLNNYLKQLSKCCLNKHSTKNRKENLKSELPNAKDIIETIPEVIISNEVQSAPVDIQSSIIEVQPTPVEDNTAPVTNPQIKKPKKKAKAV